jgi:hypothetical protein
VEGISASTRRPRDWMPPSPHRLAPDPRHHPGRRPAASRLQCLGRRGRSSFRELARGNRGGVLRKPRRRHPHPREPARPGRTGHDRAPGSRHRSRIPGPGSQARPVARPGGHPRRGQHDQFRRAGLAAVRAGGPADGSAPAGAGTGRRRHPPRHRPAGARTAGRASAGQLRDLHRLRGRPGGADSDPRRREAERRSDVERGRRIRRPFDRRLARRAGGPLLGRRGGGSLPPGRRRQDPDPGPGLRPLRTTATG